VPFTVCFSSCPSQFVFCRGMDSHLQNMFTRITDGDLVSVLAPLLLRRPGLRDKVRRRTAIAPAVVVRCHDGARRVRPHHVPPHPVPSQTHQTGFVSDCSAASTDDSIRCILTTQTRIYAESAAWNGPQRNHVDARPRVAQHV